MEMNKYQEIINQMTTEEKIDLITCNGPWHTGYVQRLNVREMCLTDGPNGVRCENASAQATDKHNLHGSYSATCFPTLALLACTWDRESAHKIGEQLASEAAYYGVDVLLGPGINHKRVPVGGRHFEYFSEDPVLTSELASEYINGLQSKGVGCSLKHYLGNNTEYNRFGVNVIIEERALQEIYLKAFRRTIKKSSPFTVMAAYNRFNGDHCAESKEALQTLLRDDIGFNGAVISDWDAVHDRVKALNAGCDLEMGFIDYSGHKQAVADALKNGEISQETLDKSCERLLELRDKCFAEKGKPTDFENGYSVAYEAAVGGMVLLKNDNIFPLANSDFCVIGMAAETPRYQGEGSSRVESFRTSSPLEELRKIYGEIPYAKGYIRNEQFDESVLNEAKGLASKHKTAIIFLDGDDYAEEESSDRKTLSLSEKHLKLIDGICSVNKRVAVVLQMGGVTEMPYLDKIQALVQSFFAGEAVGEATAALLSGKRNFSGRLAETYPVKYEDNPAYPYYAKEWEKLEYGEGIYTGYRYYDTKNVPVRFPFGYGLSYTSFSYSDMKIIRGKNKTKVSVKIKNTGNVAGAEVAMLFVAKPGADVPKKELVGFDKYYLNPGEEVNAEIEVADEDISVWNTEKHAFEVRSGVYAFVFYGNTGNIVAVNQVDI